MNTSSLYWFAEDGSYGGGLPLVAVTDRWTEEDWSKVQDATDSTRLDIARRITDRLAIEDYLEGLKADLEVEIDLHGGRTQLAYDIRTSIIATEKELAEIKES
jgi:hypothetical protein